MALTDFFRINLPYGIERNDKNEWMAFNREYKPLGWSTTEWVEYEKYPVFAKYKDLTDAKLLKIASETPGAVVKDQDGKIIRAFLYDDNTNPVDNPKYWPAYFERIKSLSKFIAQ
ncbi:MAG: hypothetical protein L6Q97_02595 [Thermoanaerobaculia bacterium]|jgi:hypothetical protein|nr:hypothetical protein [Thermoanaerobaculia bacterium]